MGKLMRNCDRIFKYAVLGLMGIILSYLTALSIHSTGICYGETRYNIGDSFIKHFICYCLVVLLFVLVRGAVMQSNHVTKYSKGLITGISILTGLILVYLVAALQVVPIEDQKWICDVAVGLKNFDFSFFLKNSYMDFFAAQQTGIVLFLYGFFSIFGKYNFVAFQLMNAVCIMISFFLIIRIYHDTHCSRNKIGENYAESGSKVLTMLFLSAFLPFLLYVTYVYGTILGLTLSLGAIRTMLSFMDSHEWKYMICTALLCGLSVWIKSNYLIFVIAILIFLLVDFLKSHNYKSMVVIIMTIISIYGIGRLSDLIVEDRIGRPLSSGVPMICYINMAFCENEKGDPVGYNGYGVNTYQEEGNNTELTGKKAMEDLKERFGEFLNDPSMFLRFMGKKIAINWNEPEFESININTKYTRYNNDRPQALVNLLQPYQNGWYAKYVNLFHAVILAGGLTWTLLCGRKEPVERFVLATVFIGGFLFSLFWESGSRYMIVYFVLLIPYAVSGYWALAGKLLENRTVKNANRKQAGIVFAIMFMFALTRLSSDFFWIHCDDEAYKDTLMQYEEDKRKEEAVLSDGRYVVSPVVMPDFGIASAGEWQPEQDAIQPAVVLAPINSDFNGVINLHHEYVDLLRIDSTQLLLSLTEDPEEGNARIIQDGDNILWRIQKVDNSQYAILYNEYCLSVRNGQLVIEPYRGEKEQIWTFTLE